VGAIQSVNNAACTTIGKMLAASPEYRDQATAVWHANHFAIFKFGANQRGGYSIGILTETFAGAGGARSFADGVDIGGEIPNPISRMANVETVEGAFPIRYLFRRRAIDSGGPGQFRGGTGGEMAIVQHRAPAGGIDYVISGKGARHPMSEGLAGGYPGAPNSYVWVHAGEEPSAAPDRLEAIKGEHERVSWGVHPLRGRDALYVRWNGGGGYGDPITRTPGAVADDVRSGVVSTVAAERIYGVALAEDGTVDLGGTTALRAALRTARLAPQEAAE
jgi:N-methylhydantoinase B